MKKLISVVLATAAIGLLPAARAEDPSLHEVYQAVHSGQLREAQAMMTQVLRDHPDSAKAHYVEAEVLARMGRSSEAQSELATAERLSPGLGFAKPEAVRELRALIAEGSQGRSQLADRGSAESRASDAGLPWGPLLIIAGAGLVLFLFLRARRMSSVAASVPAGAPGGVGYGAPGYGPVPANAPGLGSSILGGLATGAAVGAGMVAGEALAHEFLGGHDRDRLVGDGASTDASRTAWDDAGAPDFGVNDAGSWDAGGNDLMGDSGGGGDWS